MVSPPAGVPIPRRALPPQDAVGYYTDPSTRGYLADPEQVARHRLTLAQKYGYELPQVKVRNGRREGTWGGDPDNMT